MTGQWTKFGSKWLIRVDGEQVLPNGTRVTVTKRDGTVDTHKVQHSKVCQCCHGAHVYFAQRGPVRRQRYNCCATGI